MKGILFILFFQITFFAIAQDSLQINKKWEVNGYIKNLESLSFSKNFKDLISGNLLHNRLNLKFKPNEKLIVAAEFRNRLYWGDEVKLTPNFVSMLRNDNEKFNLQKAWIDNGSLVMHSNVERLYIEYREATWNARFGRQRINWGITTTWNPNDIFNSYNFLDFDYEERPGADAGKLQYFISNSVNAEIAYATTKEKNGNVAAAKYHLNKWGYDLQLITGWYKQSLTMGAGWAGNIKDAGFKGEVEYYFRGKDSIDHLNIVLEGDYMFKNGWYVNTSVLFNKSGLYQSLYNWNLVNLKLSPQNIMPTKWNIILTASKEITPLFSANMSALYAPGSNLVILLSTLKYNLATNLDADLIWQSFFAELINNFEALNHRAFIRLKWSF